MIQSQVLKVLRKSLRVEDLLDWNSFEKKYLNIQRECKTILSLPEYNTEKELSELKQLREAIKDMIGDCIGCANKALDSNKRVILEDDGGEMLGVNYGVHPHVNGGLSGITSATAAFGISPKRIDTRIGVVKAYCTRSGNGSFPTEIKGELCEHLILKGREFSDNEKRRCGWLDLNMLKLAHTMNQYSSLMVTKLDVLDEVPEIKVAIGYKIGERIFNDRIPASYERAEYVYKILRGWKQDTSQTRKFKHLPKEAKDYIRLIEDTLKVPVTWITVGRTKDHIIRK